MVNNVVKTSWYMHAILFADLCRLLIDNCFALVRHAIYRLQSVQAVIHRLHIPYLFVYDTFSNCFSCGASWTHRSCSSMLIKTWSEHLTCCCLLCCISSHNVKRQYRSARAGRTGADVGECMHDAWLQRLCQLGASDIGCRVPVNMRCA